MKIFAHLFVLMMAIVGVGLAVTGGWLASYGGSAYYVIVGVAYVVAAVLMFRSKQAGALIVLAVLAGTVAWALWESGTDFWALFARVMAPLALAGFACVTVPFLSKTASRPIYFGGATAAALLFAGGFALAFQPHGIVSPGADITPYETAAGDNTPE